MAVAVSSKPVRWPAVPVGTSRATLDIVKLRQDEVDWKATSAGIRRSPNQRFTTIPMPKRIESGSWPRWQDLVGATSLKRLKDQLDIVFLSKVDEDDANALSKGRVSSIKAQLKSILTWQEPRCNLAREEMASQGAIGFQQSLILSE
jgi:hypothetical protein